MSKEEFLARSRSYGDVRQKGCVGSFNEGIEIETNGVRTRLVAWPGMGILMGSIHVLTLAPGDTSSMYQYEQAEEMLICLKGSGEVYVRDKWVSIAPGDVAYVPDNVPHGVRNPRGNSADFVLVSQITPPQIFLYEPAGYFDIKTQSFRLDEIQRAAQRTPPGNLSTANDMRYREDHPEVRAWNLTRDDVRRGGALFNVFRGAPYGGIGVPMRIVLYPGSGTRTAGLHCGIIPPNGEADVHRHPVSDDTVFVIEGATVGHLEGDWVDIQPLEAPMAPCPVAHGGRPSPDGKSAFVIGLGAPPQLDVYMKSEAMFRDGRFTQIASEVLEWPPKQ
jgi:gentisate 1,2-dioxygenase